MTTRRAGSPPSPEQIAAGGPPPDIAIISERVIATHPVPGETVYQVAVTYRIAPHPPQVLFASLDRLPDMVYRRDHPGKPVPDDVQKKGDDALRDIIRGRRTPTGPRPRMI